MKLPTSQMSTTTPSRGGHWEHRWTLRRRTRGSGEDAGSGGDSAQARQVLGERGGAVAMGGDHEGEEHGEHFRRTEHAKLLRDPLAALFDLAIEDVFISNGAS